MNRYLKVPGVVAAIHHAVNATLKTELAPLAIKRLRKILEDDTAGARVSHDAAKTVLVLAGHTPHKAQEAPRDKQLSELKPDELRGVIDRLERELAERATPVNAPKKQEADGKALSFLD